MERHISPIGEKGLYILDTASWRTERPVMNLDRCIRCGLCLTYCPVNSIIGTEDGGYRITYDYCKGCGICAKECPHQAIEMVLEGAEG